jgi:hypothetical protein
MTPSTVPVKTVREERLKVVPITLKMAKAFVKTHHRHNKPPTGHKVSIGVTINKKLVGVAIIGRPSARHLDEPDITADDFTAEITRLCTNGHKNACSKLYRAARNTAYAMGYTKVITYTLCTEPGCSLRAAGFVPEATTKGGKWDRESRPRTDDQEASDQEKIRWRAV